MEETRVSPQSFLRYRNFRHLKLALGALGALVAGYIVHEPYGGVANGGTWFGYSLGGIAAGLMLWLTWFGVRKRRYGSAGSGLQGWLSAHVYLGLTLLLVVPLHAGFQLGWNLHTGAYALMSAVVLSGIFGVVMYASMPAQMTRNRRGQRIDALYEQVADLDSELRSTASGLPDSYARAAHVTINETRIGGSLWRQFSGFDPDCGTARAVEMLKETEETLSEEEALRVKQLREVLGRKSVLLARVRRDVRYQALSSVWLAVHIPLSVASLVAVAAHVFVVFYYR